MIIIIPARIGSKGIPKKVLRPFRGKPLISWAIEAALLVPNASTYVDTDGQDIIDFVERNYPELNIHARNGSLSGDFITLDEVCLDFVRNNKFDTDNILITIQPTSPFITSEVIESVSAGLVTQKSGSVVTVTEKKKLTWRKTSSGFEPNYQARRNRQELEPIYEENGAVLGCFIDELKRTETRMNEPVNCVTVTDGLVYDLDTALDWRLATEFANVKKIVIAIVANTEVGSGHFHRALSLLNYFPEYEITLVGIKLDLNFQKQCLESNYATRFIEDEAVLSEICADIEPSLIILDILNTTKKFITQLKNSCSAKVVSFEDTGSGATITDLTINELYPSITENPKILSGPRYSVLREEFDNPDFEVNRDIDILISFGGTDPNNLTITTLSWLADSRFANRSITVVLGLGATRQKCEINKIIETNKLANCAVITNVKSMSDLMCRANIAITASGRTIYELAACNVKTICICQNMRQLTHLFVSEINGITNLGYFQELTKTVFLDAVKEKLNSDYDQANHLKNFTKSKENVLNALRELG